MAVEIARCVAALKPFGYEVQLELRQGYPVTHNAANLEPIVLGALRAQMNGSALHRLLAPSMGAEDFASYGETVPAYFMSLGIAPSPNLHSPAFDFNDDALPVGMAALTRLAIEYLNR